MKISFQLKSQLVKENAITQWIAAPIAGASAGNAGIWVYLHDKHTVARASEQPGTGPLRKTRIKIRKERLLYMSKRFCLPKKLINDW